MQRLVLLIPQGPEQIEQRREEEEPADEPDQHDADHEVAQQREAEADRLAVGTGHAEDKTEAFRLLWSSLKTGFGLDIVDSDTDLDPLRTDPEFKRVVTSARAYFAASKH